jgi:hypothetical protein
VGNYIGSSNNKCACDTFFAEFVTYYQSIITESFTDNVLPVSRTLLPLWRYQTSTSIDAGIKPSPVIRAATSIMDGFIMLDFQQSSYTDWKYKFPAAEMSNIYSVYNGKASQGQRTDRIIQVDLWTGNGNNDPVQGVVVTQVIGGQTMTLEIGIGNPTADDDYADSWYTDHSLVLEENERIVAVGATDCGNVFFAYYGTCPSIGYAFQTAYVDANGAFLSEGRLWNPLGYDTDVAMIVAPQLAQSRNATFLPHVIAFHGWSTYSPKIEGPVIGSKIPVWLYESLE